MTLTFLDTSWGLITIVHRLIKIIIIILLGPLLLWHFLGPLYIVTLSWASLRVWHFLGPHYDCETSLGLYDCETSRSLFMIVILHVPLYDFSFMIVTLPEPLWLCHTSWLGNFLVYNLFYCLYYHLSLYFDLQPHPMACTMGSVVMEWKQTLFEIWMLSDDWLVI